MLLNASHSKMRPFLFYRIGNHIRQTSSPIDKIVKHRFDPQETPELIPLEYTNQKTICEAIGHAWHLKGNSSVFPLLRLEGSSGKFFGKKYVKIF